MKVKFRDKSHAVNFFRVVRRQCCHLYTMHSILSGIMSRLKHVHILFVDPDREQRRPSCTKFAVESLFLHLYMGI